MAIRRTTFRIYPNQTQKRVLFSARRLHGYLYNACIANRRYEWKANQRNVSYFEQQNFLPEFKKEWPEFASLHSQSLQATVKRIDLAYNAFFQGIRQLPTKQIKPSQRCPKCGAVHKEWADLSNRYHICSDCGFEIPRDRGSVMVFYHVATNQQPECGTHFVDCRCSSSTTSNSKRKHTGSMQQLGQLKRQKSCRETDGILETPSVHTAG
ncbi:MAG: zinc ribbon domain-containing protein [Phormidium sp.]